MHVSADVEKPGNESTPVTDFPNPNKRKHDENDTQRKKLKTDINERQLNYNSKMKESRKRGPNLMLMNMCQLKLIQWTKFHPFILTF